jgi:hypothetical protein
MADKAMQSLGKSQAMSGVGAAKNAQQMAAFTDMNKQMAAAVFDGRLSLEQADETMAKYAQQAGIATQASGSFLAGLSPLTIALGAVAGAVLGAAMAFKTLYPVLEEGANIAQLDASFDHLITTMTDYPDVLKDMKEASQFTVSTMAAQEGIMTLVAGSSRMMTKELTDAAPKLLEISKAANKLNPMLGDTNFMFTSLAKGVKRAEPRLIDNLGLKLRVSDANRQLAEELGKSVMELTAEEKQLAILNETLRAGDALIAQVGGSVDGLSDSFQRVEAAQADAAAGFKEGLFYALNIAGANDIWATSMRGVANEYDYMNKVRDAADRGLLGDGFGSEAGSAFAARAEMDAEAMQYYIDLIEMRIKMQERAKRIDQEQTEQELSNAEQKIQMYQIMDSWAQRLDPMAERGGRVSDRDPNDPYEQAKLERETNARKKAYADQVAAEEEWQEALSASGDAFTKRAEIRETVLAKDLKVIESWSQGIMKESQEAHDAWAAYTAELVGMTKAHIDAEQSASFFTVAIENIGSGFRTIGGASGEQADEIERLTKKLDSARTKLGDMEMGLGQFGRKEEAIAKSQGKLVNDIAILEGALASLNDVQTETVAVQQAAIWNWDNITKAMGEAAANAGLATEDYLRYKVAVGDITKEQAEAALSATALEVAIGKAFSGVEAGELEPEDVLAFVESAQKAIDAADFSILLTPEVEAEAVAKSAREKMEEQRTTLLGGYFVQMQTEIDPTTAKEQLIEEFLGEDAIEPAIVTVEALTDDASTAIQIWKDGIVSDPIVVNVKMGGAEDFINSNTIFPEGHAYGGSLRGGHAVLVGERGPEIITPAGNSEVIPNDKIGGGTPQINLSIHVGGSIGMDDFVTIVEDKMLEAMQQYGL